MNIPMLAERINSAFWQNDVVSLLGTCGVPREFIIGDGRFFGNYYVPLLAEIIGCEDEEMIVDLGVAFLIGRFFVILQDRALDDRNIEGLVMSPIAYAEFVRLMTIRVAGTGFRQDIYYVQYQAARALIEEADLHHQKVNAFGDNGFEKLADKTAIVIIPAMELCRLQEKRELLAGLCQAVRQILIAIQLCDDLADIREDLANGNYTMPLTACLSKVRSGQYPLGSLFEEGIYGKYLTEAIRRVSSAKAEIEEINPKSGTAWRYIDALHGYLESVYDKFHSLPFEQRQDQTELLTDLEPGKISVVKIQ